MAQRDVWWANLPDPVGSEPGFRRPVLVVQGDALNRSRLATVLCSPLTSNLKWADAPGNVRLSARITGLRKDSVAVIAQLIAIDRDFLTQQVGQISKPRFQLVLAGIDVVLGR